MNTLKQVAALPVRRTEDGTIEILLVTSRETGRWVIPKGWPSAKLKDREAALREAEEEAGVAGKIKSKPLGTFRYFKRTETGFRDVEVDVYLLEVSKVRRHWPEERQRQRAWLSTREACEAVNEPGLQAIIGQLGQAAKKRAAEGRPTGAGADTSARAGRGGRKAA